MKYGGIIVLLLAFLTACQPALETVPSSEVPVINSQPKATQVNLEDACEGITCTDGRVCSNGACICEGKLCGSQCIADDACCTDDDCEGDSTCESRTCKAPICSYNSELVEGSCECKEGFSFCREQDKCIPKDSCCRHTDCPRGDRCTESIFKTSLCFEVDSKKKCRLLADNGRSEFIEFETDTYNIDLEQFLSTGDIHFTINGENVTLAANSPLEFEGAQVFQEGIETTGGFCKEDNTE